MGKFMGRSVGREIWDRICHIAKDATVEDNYFRVWRNGPYDVYFRCEQCKIDWCGPIGG